MGQAPQRAAEVRRLRAARRALQGCKLRAVTFNAQPTGKPGRMMMMGEAMREHEVGIVVLQGTRATGVMLRAGACDRVYKCGAVKWRQGYVEGVAVMLRAKVLQWEGDPALR